MGETPKFVISVEAGVDLSTHRFKAVVLDANGKAVLPAAGVKMLGILQNDPIAGAAASVMVHGLSRVVLSGAITPMAELATAADGTLLVNGVAAAQSGALAVQNGASGTTVAVLLK